MYYLINYNYWNKDIIESLFFFVSGYCLVNGGSSYVWVGEGRLFGIGGGDYSVGGRYGNYLGLRGNLYFFV